MRADAELPWFLGTGPSTWAGDAGLRSNLSGQVAHLEASKLSAESSRARAADIADPWRLPADPRWHPERWQAKAVQSTTVSVEAVEDDMIERTAKATLAAEVEARLGQLSRLFIRTLRLHYSGRSLPFDISPAVVLVARARVVCGGEPSLGVMRTALTRLPEVERAALTLDTKALVRAAQVAYEDAHVTRSRRLQVDDPRGR